MTGAATEANLPLDRRLSALEAATLTFRRKHGRTGARDRMLYRFVGQVHRATHKLVGARWDDNAEAWTGGRWVRIMGHVKAKRAHRASPLPLRPL